MSEPYAYAWQSEAPFDNASWPRGAPWEVKYDVSDDKYRMMCGGATVAIVGSTLVAHWMARTNNEAQARNRSAQQAAQAEAAARASERKG